MIAENKIIVIMMPHPEAAYSDMFPAFRIASKAAGSQWKLQCVWRYFAIHTDYLSFEGT